MNRMILRRILSQPGMEFIEASKAAFWNREADTNRKGLFV